MPSASEIYTGFGQVLNPSGWFHFYPNNRYAKRIHTKGVDTAVAWTQQANLYFNIAIDLQQYTKSVYETIDYNILQFQHILAISPGLERNFLRATLALREYRLWESWNEGHWLGWELSIERLNEV